MVFSILRANFPDRCKGLEQLCREQQKLQDGEMRAALVRFINGDFRRAIEDVSRQLGWTVEDFTCYSVFLDRVADHLGVSRDILMQGCMAVTPCLDVRDTPPYKICKSNINLVDLFQVILCNGKDMIGLRQKNNCSMALLAPVHASGAKYAFEIGGIFDIGGKCCVYLTRGIIINVASTQIVSIDSECRCALYNEQGQVSGAFKITDVAIACRFGPSVILHWRQESLPAETSIHDI
eukprot:jgi/Picre1/33655/NNA_001135.t1